MKSESLILLNDAMRSDFYCFVQRCFQALHSENQLLLSYYIEAMAHSLEECRRGRSTRLIVNIPPRKLKSITGSVAFPAWLLGHDPSLSIVCVSYSRELAFKHQKDFRTIMESDWYRELFPNTHIDPRKNAEAELATTAGGGRLATSVDGTLTGRGGDLIIIDDPQKADDALSGPARESTKEWYFNTLQSRLNNQRTGVIILIMQRLHQDDLSGYLLSSGRWDHLCLPAIAERTEEVQIGPHEFHVREPGDLLHPELEPIERLDEIRFHRPFLFNSQYQQSPIPETGNLIPWESFKTYESLPKWQRGSLVVQSWDCGSKVSKTSSFSVCTTWLVDGGSFYLLDVLRDKFRFSTLRDVAVEHARKWNANVILVEDATLGTPLLDELGSADLPAGARVVGIIPDHSKETRMEAQSAKIADGRVFLPEDAPWKGEFREELLAFPAGSFSDQVDSMSQVFLWADGPGGPGHEPKIAETPPYIVRGNRIFATGPKRKPHDLRNPRGGTRRR